MAENDVPDPGKVEDLAEFIAALGLLRLWAGGPSYRTLAKRVGPLLRPPQAVSHTTIGDMFQPRRRWLDIDLLTALLRALGLAEPDVARWRTACVRVHADARNGGPAGVLRQLPADSVTFTGRAEPLRLLMEAVTASPTSSADQPASTVVISAVEGMAGVGKTQLAVHAAHELVRAGRYGDMQLFVNLHGFDPDRPSADPSAVLEGFLRALQVPAQAIPDDLQDRAAMFRDRVRDKSVLIVLDNAASEQQVQDLIPTGPDIMVLITSRRSMAALDGAVLHQLEVFSQTEAVTLLERIAGAERVAAEPEAAAELVAMCGCLPLAVALAAARLRARPQWRLANLLEYLRDSGLDAVSIGGRDLRGVFGASLQELTEDQRRMFLLLGVQPGDDVSVEAAAALAGLPVGRVRPILETLCDDHLVVQRVPGRFELHDLLRAYAVDCADAALPEPERAAAMHRLLFWYGEATTLAAATLLPSLGLPPGPPRPAGLPETRFSDSAAAVAWFETERGNLSAAGDAATAAGSTDSAWRIPAASSVFLAVAQIWPACDRVLRIALARARDTEGPAAEAWIQNRLAGAALELGRPAEAEQLWTSALATRRGLGDRDGEAAILNNLVIHYSRTERAEAGLEYGRQALDLARRQGNTDREASALNATAGCLTRLGRHAEALEYMRQVLAIRTARGDGHRLGLAYTVTGSAHLALGQFEEADSCYRESHAISLAAGDTFGQAEANLGRARVLRARGRLSAAREYLAEVTSIFDTLKAHGGTVEEARTLLAELEEVEESGDFWAE